MPNTILTLAARNTTRKKTRTLLTASMVASGVALLTVALAWQSGIFGGLLTAGSDSAGHVRVVDADYAKREQLMPLYENLPDVAPLLAAVRKHPQVRSAMPKITSGVTVTVGEEIGEVFALAVGAPEAYFRVRLGAKDKLDKGAWFAGGPDELVIGHRIAQEVGAKLGDELILLGMTQDGAMSPVKGTVIGIVKGGNALLDQQVFMPLAKAQYLTDIPNGATELVVYTDKYEDAAVLAAELRGLRGLEGTTVQAWSEREPWREMLGMVDAVWGVLILIIVFLTSLGIWNTMMMSVLERTHEIGVLRAMGLSRLGSIWLFVVEAIAIGVGGGGVGVVIGAVPAWLLETYGVSLGESVTQKMGTAMPMEATVYADLSVEIVVGSFLLGLLMAVLGSALPALRAAAIQPVSAMRTGR